MDHYDAIVIGSGQAGTPLSIELSAAGRKVALIESQHVGGTCINVGCTPTKTMVASARIAYLARRSADYGVRCGPVNVDMEQVHRRKQGIVDDFRAGVQRRLDDAENEMGVAAGNAEHKVILKAGLRLAQNAISK